MCRYAARDYLTHWACPPCRHTDKRPKLTTWTRPQAGQSPACPQCKQPMVDLGRDFHAPRRRDVAQWRKVEVLAEAGVRFESCGCSGPGRRPRTLADAKTQLGLRRRHRRNYAEARR